MEYYNNLLESHGNNNLLMGYDDFDMSKFPIYTAQGEENFIDDIYNNLNENFIYNDNEEITQNNEIKEDNLIDKNNSEQIKLFVENNENSNIKKSNNEKSDIKESNIEEFTMLKDLLNKERKERETEKMLLFVIVIGICIILLFHSKK